MREELKIKAAIENTTVVTEFVRTKLGQAGCPMKVQMRIELAIDEIFSNICHYAYAPEQGSAEISVEVPENSDCVDIIFVDEGIPYNPLEKEEPDVTASAEERGIGGLGIFLVKKVMDEVEYERKDGKNILRIRKYFK